MKLYITAAAVAFALSACVPATPHYLVAPSDPNVPGPGPRYATVTAGVRDYRPVGPRDWREQNRAVAPADTTQDRGQDAAAGARRGR